MDCFGHFLNNRHFNVLLQKSVFGQRTSYICFLCILQDLGQTEPSLSVHLTISRDKEEASFSFAECWICTTLSQIQTTLEDWFAQHGVQESVNFSSLEVSDVWCDFLQLSCEVFIPGVKVYPSGFRASGFGWSNEFSYQPICWEVKSPPHSMYSRFAYSFTIRINHSCT